jgi:hypothetical protein
MKILTTLLIALMFVLNGCSGSDVPENDNMTQELPAQVYDDGAPPIEESAIANDEVYVSFSNTAFDFPKGDFVSKYGSVPDVLVIDDRIYIYMVGIVQRRISFVYSDDGSTWTEQEALEIKDMPEDLNPVDPSVILLPDGRYRLYFYDLKVKAPGVEFQDSHEFYSAISDDGLKFEMEAGFRLVSDEYDTMTDPNVVWLSEDEWFMYFASDKGVVVATANDGLEFTIDTHLNIEGIPGAMVLDDNRIRLYACGKSGTSIDGIIFEMDSIPSSYGCGPSLTKYMDGFVMAYKNIAL